MGSPSILGLAASRLNHCFWLLSRRPPYARGRRRSKTQNTQCTKCTKKTQKTQCTRCTKGGRWKMGGGTGQNSGFLNEFSQRKLGLESVNEPNFPGEFSKTQVKPRFL